MACMHAWPASPRRGSARARRGGVRIAVKMQQHVRRGQDRVRHVHEGGTRVVRTAASAAGTACTAFPSPRKGLSGTAPDQSSPDRSTPARGQNGQGPPGGPHRHRPGLPGLGRRRHCCYRQGGRDRAQQRPHPVLDCGSRPRAPAACCGCLRRRRCAGACERGLAESIVGFEVNQQQKIQENPSRKKRLPVAPAGDSAHPWSLNQQLPQL